MNIAIIGAGNVGTALASGWTKSGHQIVFGVRDDVSAKTTQAIREFPNAKTLPIAEAIASAEVVVIATPAAGVKELLPYLSHLPETTIIDTTNTIGPVKGEYPTAYHAITALPGTPHVVKCFNSTGFENMRNPIYGDTAIDMFAAGDSPTAKQKAATLAADIGFANCHDFGGSERVELLEKFALSWINLAIFQGQGRNIAFRILTR